MIRIDRQELRDVAIAFLLANTPYSLYQALVATPVVRRMMEECSPAELEAYYDHITARERRTEVEMGLAYAVLVALLTADRPRNPVDVSRLLWGQSIDELVQRSGRATQSLLIRPSTPSPVIRQQQDTRGGSGLVIPGSDHAWHGENSE